MTRYSYEDSPQDKDWHQRAHRLVDRPTTIRFGSEEYFQELDRQVNAMLAPQLSAGIMRQEHANELRVEAQRKARKQVNRFYCTPMFRSPGENKQVGRVALPCRIVTNHAEQAKLLRQRKQRNYRQARRKAA